MITRPLNEILNDFRSGKPDKIMGAYQAILEAGRAAVTVLLEALGDENNLVRWAAAAALGDIGASEAIPPLEQRLEDSNVSVRIRAAQSLGKLHRAEGIPVLIKALRSEDVMIGHPPELASDYANQVLMSITGQTCGFNGSASESERLEAIRRWEEWWEENKGTFKP